MSFYWLLFLVFIRNGNGYDCKTRKRYAWHLLSDEDKLIYIDALHELNNRGIINILSETHNQVINRMQAHYTSAFFPWHRFFLFEFEEYIRNMGGKYSCFTLPWWDFNHDSGSETDPYVFNSGLGGDGEPLYHCVNTDTFTQKLWITRHVCNKDNPNDIEGQDCCLKRCSTKQEIMTPSELMLKMLDLNTYGTDLGYREFSFEDIHNSMHSFLGGNCGGDGTQLISFYGPDDPLLFLIHGYIDYIWWVWNACQGYSLIDPNDLDSYPNAYVPYPVNNDHFPSSGLDDELFYKTVDSESWWGTTQHIKPTPRSQFNLVHTGVEYDRGTLWYEMDVETYCDKMPDIFKTDNINPYLNQYTKTDVEIYRESLNAALSNNKIQNKHSKRDILQTLASKTCQYNRLLKGKNICDIPNYNDGSIELCDESLKGQYISLETLLNKDGINDNECLKEIRINTYSWAKHYNKLYELCNGKLDNICETPNIDITIELDTIVLNKINSQTTTSINNNNTIKDGNSLLLFVGILFILIIIICAYLYSSKQCCVKKTLINDDENIALLNHDNKDATKYAIY